MENKYRKMISLIISSFFGVLSACTIVLGPMIGDVFTPGTRLAAFFIAMAAYLIIGFFTGLLAPGYYWIWGLLTSLPAIIIVAFFIVSTWGVAPLPFFLPYLLMPFGSATLGAFLGERFLIWRKNRG